MAEVATEDAGCEFDDGVMALDCEANDKGLGCPCRDPACREGKDAREEKGKLPLREDSFCAVGLRVAENVEANGEDEDEFRVHEDESSEEFKLVDRGVRPRRGAGSPQTDCCPLTGRKPEL